MIIRAVLHHGKLVGLYSCGTDAAEMAKRYPGASIVVCRLNSETAASTGIDVATTHRSATTVRQAGRPKREGRITPLPQIVVVHLSALE